MTKGKAIDIFCFDKPWRIVLSISRGGNGRYGSILAKDIDCTFAHTTKLLRVMEKYGVVESFRQGRINMVRLTKKGENLAHCLEVIQAL